MKNWSYGINNYYKTASISLETAPWHIFVIETITEFICDIIPPISLPNIKFRLRDKDSIEFNQSEWTTVKEWYGDLKQLFHSVIHIPISNFCWDRIVKKYIEVDYDKLKEMFYKKDKEFFDDCENDKI